MLSTHQEIDRIGPTRRPQRQNAGHQTWRNLLFVHWPIPVEALRPLIPSQLAIDTFGGNAYIGLVPFEMEDVAPWWLPSLFAFRFLETNLRTYVHLNGQPGVYFFSLEAASWLAVQAARHGWQLPYYHAGMRVERRKRGESEVIEYESSRYQQGRPRLYVEYEVGEPLPPATPGTLEFFLLERYLLFTKKRQDILCGQVYHTPYPAHTAHVHKLEESLVQAAGLPPTQGMPTLAHFSPGVEVEVFDLEVVA